MQDDLLRVYHMVNETEVLGPGKLFGLWTQGCPRRCPGCIAPGSHALDGGKLIQADRLAAHIRSLPGISGIVVSGGEPFLQSAPLARLLRQLREGRDFGVAIYTGYWLSELRKMQDPAVREILNGLCDLLIDGPYVEELNDGMSLRGSANQGVHCLTPRWEKEAAELYGKEGRQAEVCVEGDDVFVVGIPQKGAKQLITRALEEQKGPEHCAGGRKGETL